MSKGVSRDTPPPLIPPNLRVDYFSNSTSVESNSPERQPHHLEDQQGNVDAQQSIPSPTCLEQSPRSVNHHKQDRQPTGNSSVPIGACSTTSLSSGVGFGGGSINVTPNPMDTAVCSQPRATIVVQQVNLKTKLSLLNLVFRFVLTHVILFSKYHMWLLSVFFNISSMIFSLSKTCSKL